MTPNQQVILYQLDGGGVALMIPSPDCGLTAEQIAAKDVPQGKSARIFDLSSLPDPLFHEAWVLGDVVQVDIEKARLIGHSMRRAMREQEFAPHDEVIAKRIPGVAMEEAEAARQAIRDKYAQVQISIDLAISVEEIKQALALVE